MAAATPDEPLARLLETMADTPALLLGLDAMRRFRSVAIDFANREIRFARPQSRGDSVNIAPFGT